MEPLPIGPVASLLPGAGASLSPAPRDRAPARGLALHSHRSAGAAAAGVAYLFLQRRQLARSVARRTAENDPVAFCPPPTSYSPEADDLDYWQYPEYDFLNSDAWDIDGYMTLLQEAADSYDWQRATSLLQEMRSYGVQPDVGCYALALVACKRGAAGHKAFELIDEMWKKELEPTPGCYAEAIAACTEEGCEDEAEQLRAELRNMGPAQQVERFQLVPRIGWGKEVAMMGCGAHNSIGWDGKGALPYPSQSCWLIPSQDESAVAIAENADELRQRGWKLLTCAPSVVDILRNKGKLRKLAEELGLLALLPEHYEFFSEAKYPCILKPAIGTFGKNTHIVESKDQAMRLAPDGLDEHWVLQELIVGEFEYSTSLLVHKGEIFDWAGIRYQYSLEAYVWPHVRLVDQDLRSVPAEHLQIFQKFLVGFSGICNFNYKLRPDGSMCIFEVNPRVGGDLSFDIPKKRARAFLEKMDAMFS